MRLSLLIITLLVAGCRPSPPPLPPLADLEPQVRAALEEAHAAADRDRSAATLGRLGLVFFAFDYPREAEAALQSAARQAARNSDWPYYLGVLARREGRLEEAIRQFRLASGASGEENLADVRLAESLLESGSTEEAASVLRQVLSRDSTLTLAHALLGESHLESGDASGAVRHLQAALSMQPNATQLHAPLASAFAALGDASGAEFHRLRRGNRPVRILDRRIAALDSLRLALGATRALRAEALIRQGQYAEAVQLLEAEATENPSPTTLVTLGVALANGGSYAGAIGAFRQAIALDPTSDRAYFNLGMMGLAVGDSASAERSLRSATTVGSFNRSAHIELGALLRRSERCSEAIDHLSPALADDPTSTSVRLDLVLCLDREGRQAEAAAVVEEGLRAAPDNLAFVDAMARLLATSSDPVVRDPDRALELAEAALSIQQRTETLETAALAMSAIGGRDQEAIRILDQAVFQADRDGLGAYSDHLTSLKAAIQRNQSTLPAWPPFVYRR